MPGKSKCQASRKGKEATKTWDVKRNAKRDELREKRAEEIECVAIKGNGNWFHGVRTEMGKKGDFQEKRECFLSCGGVGMGEGKEAPEERCNKGIVRVVGERSRELGGGETTIPPPHTPLKKFVNLTPYSVSCSRGAGEGGGDEKRGRAAGCGEGGAGVGRGEERCGGRREERKGGKEGSGGAEPSVEHRGEGPHSLEWGRKRDGSGGCAGCTAGAIRNGPGIVGSRRGKGEGEVTLFLEECEERGMRSSERIIGKVGGD
ncbi:hypothetical protein J437_LFUL010856 [Ladona fulva]|uniref:Uncharacterized protein n=1 Tax=Ladona fulva TaxID=123851 RepID=A0A8K0K9B0_LADFU|nr:hypothetical protein J437_LFUL010856 [Ladona fulva]